MSGRPSPAQREQKGRPGVSTRPTCTRGRSPLPLLLPVLQRRRNMPEWHVANPGCVCQRGPRTSRRASRPAARRDHRMPTQAAATTPPSLAPGLQRQWRQGSGREYSPSCQAAARWRPPWRGLVLVLLSAFSAAAGSPAVSRGAPTAAFQVSWLRPCEGPLQRDVHFHVAK